MGRVIVHSESRVVQAALVALPAPALDVILHDEPTQLRIGAEVLPKPVRWHHLLQAVRRAGQAGVVTVPLGNCQFEPGQRLLHKPEGSERLTEKEAALLELLSHGEVVSREALLEKVWGYRADLETHTLETHIYRLRQKLEVDAANPKILLTSEGGYQLCRDA